MAKVHPTAIVDPGAELAEGVEIGPYSIVGGAVRIGAGSVVGAHCVIEGRTTIGSGNKISAFNALGGVPQDKKYAGEPTELVIGDGNTIREFCTIHVGTIQDAGITRIGDDNWIMNSVHIAHDCQVASHTIIAGYSGLAGHVELGDWAIVGGMSGLLQFVRVGAHAMIGFQSHVSQDVPPFMMVDGHPLQVRGFNAEGLRRRGFSAERIGVVKQIHRLLYRDGLTFDEARARIGELAAAVPQAEPDVRLVVEFLATAKRGIAR